MTQATQATTVEKAGKSVKGALDAERIQGQQSKADTTAATAGFSAHAFGTAMAKDFYESNVRGMNTWNRDILKLVQECKDTDRETAMQAIIQFAKSNEEKGDTTVIASLKKRVSEARRIFAYAMEDYDKCVKLLKGKGTWHEKVSSTPTRGKAGRPAGQGAGKTTAPQTMPNIPVPSADMPDPEKTALDILSGKAENGGIGKGQAAQPQTSIAEAMKQAEATDSNIPQKPGASMLKLSDITKAISGLSVSDTCKVLDNILFFLSLQKQDEVVAGMAKQMLEIKDKHDNMEVRKASSL